MSASQTNLTSKTGPEGTYNYSYVPFGSNGAFKLQSVSAPNGYQTGYEYDGLGRLQKRSELIEGETFAAAYEYNSAGQVTKLTYPSGWAIQKQYNNAGYLTKVTSPQGDLFETMTMNARSQYTLYRQGNGLLTQNTYNDFGMLQNTQAGAVFDLALDWDVAAGNVMKRSSLLKVREEVFTYDDDNLNLNRLTSFLPCPTGILCPVANKKDIEYQSSGNISYKSDVGVYHYDAARPHAVNAIMQPEGAIPLLTQDITYTPFNKTETVTEGDFDLEITYGADNQRRKSILKENNTEIRKIIYTGGYERIAINNDEYEVHYVVCGPGLAAMNVRKNGGENQLFYVYTDHLGSMLTLTDAIGNIVYEQNFDPWGRGRHPTNWWDYDAANPNPKPPWLIRGFTGHEHLPEFGLINMNGRVYDPVLSRVNSPDNFVQEPNFSQSYNRYSYTLNNPLKYTDPTGDFFVADSWLVGFVDGWFSTGSGRWSAGWNEANLRAGNDAKIWGGLFVTDRNKTLGGRIWEVASRFTWQLPQTIGGFMTSHAHNTLGLRGGVESVEYEHGTTVTKTGGHWGAVTQGSYIVGDSRIKADAHNWLFQHEYGHYLQSQSMGWAYYPRVGIPSSRSAGIHDLHPVEQDANRRAFLYFNKHMDGFYVSENERNQGRGWDFFSNPLNVDGSGHRDQYIDYRNSSDFQSLDKIKVTAKWYDYAAWLTTPAMLPVNIAGPIGVGLYNARRYNR